MLMKFGEGKGPTAARMAVAENATSTSGSILDIAFESLLNVGENNFKINCMTRIPSGGALNFASALHSGWWTWNCERRVPHGHS